MKKKLKSTLLLLTITGLLILLVEVAKCQPHKEDVYQKPCKISIVNNTNISLKLLIGKDRDYILVKPGLQSGNVTVPTANDISWEIMEILSPPRFTFDAYIPTPKILSKTRLFQVIISKDSLGLFSKEVSPIFK